MSDTLKDKQAILRYELRRVCRIMAVKQPKLTFVNNLKTCAGLAYSPVRSVPSTLPRIYNVEEGRIEINNYILELNDVECGIDTLHHELAHIVADCSKGERCNHNHFWRTCYAAIHQVPKDTVSMYHSLKVPESISKSKKKTGTIKL